MDIKIRNPKRGESEKIFEMLLAIDFETEFMMYERGERKKTQNALSNIENMIDKSIEGSDFFLIAENKGEMVGFITANRGNKNRIKHSACIVVGIREKFRGIGIGTEFFKRLNAWAVENKIVRLELSVLCENEITKKLYENNGFEIEGIRKKSICINGEYKDEFLMSKII